ncbi:EscU/YscU/HrcU family type III secretion system export apparatus switch protein [Fluviibacterium sp. S390]|uniref:EscU/YscU/HrcU family type III secretion system export apparatus switch protein n=1 Tax=Fluviibacterium sp. S390 TaxID=3415139 RepID=UPI003C7E5249
MSDQESPGDKPYDPSPKKLEDARKKGEIPRSADLLTAASYGGSLLALTLLGPWMVTQGGTVLMVLLDRADSLSEQMLSDGGQSLAGGMMARFGLAVAPVFLLPAALVLTTTFALRSFLVTPSKLAPKLNRISPLASMKNKFGRSGLFEFAKSFTKLLVISALLGLYLSSRLETMVTTLYLGPSAVTVEMARMALEFMVVVLVVTVAIGGVDYLWQRAEHLRKHRMSHKEMTDEAKQTEGDPQMKQQRRQKGYDIATNRMMAEVPKADVVIVNPQHFAVALKWDRSNRGAPVCVAKGVDEVAARIREAARGASVPLHRDPPTARALHATTEIGQEIAPDHYKAVAAAIRFADRMRKLRSKAK